MRHRRRLSAGRVMLTAFGVISAATMVTAYSLETRAAVWIAVFAAGCAATAIYGLLIEAWIFAILESIWASIALRRFRARRADA